MTKKLFLTNALLSFFGVLSFFMVFVRLFDEKDSYSVATVIVVIALICLLSSAILNFLNNGWIFYLVVFGLILIFMWFFRYELFGGYMTYFNRIATEYSNYYDAEVYFAVLKKKYELASDTVMTMYFTLGFMATVYPVLISGRKLALMPAFVTLIGAVVPLLIEKLPSIPFLLLAIVFIIEMFIITSTASIKETDVQSRLSVQTVSVVIGIALMAIGGLAALLVPKEGYKKSPYFDTVADTAVKIYNNTLNKIESALTGYSKETGEADGSKMIDNDSLGSFDSIEYDYKEMFTAIVYTGASRIYVKQYVGQDFDTNKWTEPDQNSYSDIVSYMLENGTTTQTFTAENLNKALNLDEFNEYLSIRYTGLSHEISLMPLYSLMKTNTKGECYYEDISDGTYISFIDLSEDNIQKVAEYISYNNVSDLEPKYSEYVKENYLTVNTKCADEFKEIVSKYGTVTDAATTFEMANYIRQYLADRCEYTLSPGKLPKGEEFIDYFFNTSKKGYCTYFASTAVMMLRSAGIPARYVTGFSFSPTSDIIDSRYINGRKYNEVKVLDTSAHAWVEFYVDGFGWVNYEVTPGNFEKEELPTESETETTTVQAETTTSAATTTAVNETTTANSEKTTEYTTTEENAGDKSGISTKTKKLILFIAFIILLIAIFISAVFIRYRIIITNRELNYKDNLDKNNKNCIRLNYGRFESILKFVGFKRETDMSLTDYGKKLADKCKFIETEDTMNMIRIYEKAAFSDEASNLDEVRETETILNLLRNKVYSELNIFKKIIFKYFYIN